MHIGFRFEGTAYCLRCAMDDDSVPVDDRGERHETDQCDTVRLQDPAAVAPCGGCGHRIRDAPFARNR